MRKTRVIDKKTHRILMGSVLIEFVATLLGFVASEPALPLVFLSQAIVFLVLDRLGLSALEVDFDCSTYTIYPSSNFSKVIIENGEKKTLPLLPGRKIVEISGKEIVLGVRPKRFLPTVLVEFEGEEIKLSQVPPL